MEPKYDLRFVSVMKYTPIIILWRSVSQDPSGFKKEILVTPCDLNIELQI